MLKPWRDLPRDLKIPEVRPYYEILYRRRGSLLLKRGFDFSVSLIMLILLFPVFLFIAVMIKLDSRGPVFYRQERVTAGGKIFRIYKFRTMVTDADKKGARLTQDGDPRITDMGKKLRGLRLDELPQLINILKGEMSFVGTRPEVLEYVKEYLPEWRATLLVPAGVTSLASVKYRHEDEELERLMKSGMTLDQAYLQCILPEKMKYNLDEMKCFTVFHDLGILIRTVIAVLH